MGDRSSANPSLSVRRAMDTMTKARETYTERVASFAQGNLFGGGSDGISLQVSGLGKNGKAHEYMSGG